MSKTHILETEATCWEAVERGEKRFEVRRNDRFFQRGDLVTLRKLTVDGKRYAHGKRHTANDIFVKIRLRFGPSDAT